LIGQSKITHIRYLVTFTIIINHICLVGLSIAPIFVFADVFTLLVTFLFRLYEKNIN